MRKEFEITHENMNELLLNIKSPPPTNKEDTPQNRFNFAWEKLGSKLGFIHTTMQVSSKGDNFFTAEST
jgi:hypothetical protein